MEFVFLSDSEIDRMIEWLVDEMDDPALAILRKYYYRSTWIENSVWSLDDITVYVQPMRTKMTARDIEKETRTCQPRILPLDLLLREEATMIPLACFLPKGSTETLSQKPTVTSAALRSSKTKLLIN